MREGRTLYYLDLKNAANRARWTGRYFSGDFCDDLRSPEEQHNFEVRLRAKLAHARRFLEGDRCAA